MDLCLCRFLWQSRCPQNGPISRQSWILVNAIPIHGLEDTSGGLQSFRKFKSLSYLPALTNLGHKNLPPSRRSVNIMIAIALNVLKAAEVFAKLTDYVVKRVNSQVKTSA